MGFTIRRAHGKPVPSKHKIFKELISRGAPDGGHEERMNLNKKETVPRNGRNDVPNLEIRDTHVRATDSGKGGTEKGGGQPQRFSYTGLPKAAQKKRAGGEKMKGTHPSSKIVNWVS